eukprot:g15926.t1
MCNIQCETRVGNRSAVRIAWFRGGVPVQEEETARTSLDPGEGDAHRVVSRLTLFPLDSGSRVNYTCVLQHSEAGIIDWQEHIFHT